jgi:hypothetical protein
MVNAKQEFIDAIEGKSSVVAAVLRRMGDCGGYNTFILPEGYTSAQFESFLDSIDFAYDAGYGAPVLDGFIWYADSTWSEREEYDGAEWWDYKQRPDIAVGMVQAAGGEE